MDETKIETEPLRLTVLINAIDDTGDNLEPPVAAVTMMTAPTPVIASLLRGLADQIDPPRPATRSAAPSIPQRD